MIDDDDDLDALLFDEPDQDTAERQNQNTLVTGARPPTPEMINQLEAAYRSQGLPPVVFIEDDEGGQPYVGNAAQLAQIMGLPGEILPTEEQFDAWAARRNWASWSW
jgi:hypothetical protein